MKKLFFCFVLVTFISTIAVAQNFGVNAGATIASAKGKDEDGTQKSDGKVGITAGVFAKIPVAESIGFMPVLNYTQKGGKLKGSETGYSYEEKLTLNYVELLLNLLYNAPAGQGKFMAGLGPVVSYGVGGKYKDKTTFNGQTDEDEGDIEFGNDENKDHFKPFEFGGNILAGYEFSCGVFVMLNYYLGFSNIALYSDASFKNRYLAIRIGYLLSALNKK